jgi:hypothetical protein
MDGIMASADRFTPESGLADEGIHPRFVKESGQPTSPQADRIETGGAG